jgi:N-acetylglutamate synthase-like GNAT family acetyltransferase
MKVTLDKSGQFITKFSKEEGIGAGIAVYLTISDQNVVRVALDSSSDYRWWIQSVKNLKVCWIDPFRRWIDIDDEKDLSRAEVIFSVDYEVGGRDCTGGRITPEIMRELYEEMDFNGFHADKRTLEKDKIMLSNSLYVSASYNNKIIGFCRAVSDGAYDFGIYDVMVLPKYQTCGIGNELMLRLLREIKKHEFIKIFLFSAKGKERWYSKFGFGVARAEVLEIRND